MEWKLTDRSTDQLIGSVWVTASSASELLIWAQFAGFPWNSWSNADTLRWNHCWWSEVSSHNNHNHHTLETGCFVTILQSGCCADPAGLFERNCQGSVLWSQNFEVFLLFIRWPHMHFPWLSLISSYFPLQVTPYHSYFTQLTTQQSGNKTKKR